MLYSRAFLINLVRDNIIRVYKFEKRADGLPTNVKSAIDFPKVSPTLSIPVHHNAFLEK